MAFILILLATLSLISHTTSAPPSRVPACVERLNPFDWRCDNNANAQNDAETVPLAARDDSITSSDYWTIQFVDTASEASSL